MKSSINENIQVNMENWFPVDTSNFSTSKLRKYKQRKKALDLYLSTQYSLEQVAVITKLSQSEIKRIRKRALTLSENGIYFGYLACIPNLNLKGYKRSNPLMLAGAGRFNYFLEKFPNVKQKLDAWALGRSSPSHVAVRGRFYKRIYKAFRQCCQDEGVDINFDYPFTNNDMGMGAVRNYCVRLKNSHFAQAAKVDYGDSSGRLCVNSVHSISPTASLQPYDVVQLDGHKVDTEISIKLMDEYGDIQRVNLSRIWLLTLIDTASRAVLGYSISLKQNYSSEDVLTCIAGSLQSSEAMLPGLPYYEIEECKGRLFNCIKFDNAFSQTSSWLQEKLIEIGVQEVITNRPARPRSNAIVERFFQTLEEESFHQFPTTTGSSPKDPRTRNPLKAANDLAIHVEDIEHAAKLTIQWYNNCPHSSLNGSSPLEFLNNSLLHKSDLVRSLSEDDLSLEKLFKRQFPLKIRGNKAQGHPPYVQFKNARYSSPTLTSSPELIGESAIFETDIRDIRKGRLFKSNGKYLAEVSVNRQWAEHQHSLRDRIAILKLAKDKKIQFEGNSPITKYIDFLAERSLISRKERNEYIRVSRILKKDVQEKKKEIKTKAFIPEKTIFLSKISNLR
ncbi:hypothetical protein Q7A_1948 [Methylophaga nitratireducenticrescens]|uniref:Integrase family protein n=1 Tax=Methylophaga nitratireducenticrescens TaxID=754476 RepID=I1XK46_METNJ|nr:MULTISPECIES: DDE-type integrase/transposase/recombinase [Methylophaga]AFI84765.1 hypothetical protein Q7A_1948 [Methylophaga nitratireducenticrescens]MDO8825971.1 DDE-type integrase/transposase/recombinase [Methylophaga sp.]